MIGVSGGTWSELPIAGLVRFRATASYASSAATRGTHGAGCRFHAQEHRTPTGGDASRGRDERWYGQDLKLASASASMSNTSNTVMSWVTWRMSVIFWVRFRSFILPPRRVIVV
jgi:hypothetical protein